MMVEFINVTKVFGNGTKALDDVSFLIDSGEFAAITGPSGAGKTTLLKLMMKEISFSKGKIRIDGDNINKISRSNTYLLRRKIGAIFQDFKIIMDRTVKENVALGLEILDLEPSVVDLRIKELLELTGLGGKEDVFPIQLSGGEMQRVVIARALAPQPKIIFADEPTGNLDTDNAWSIIQLLKDINEQGTAVILSTHDKAIIKKLGIRSIEIKAGKILKDSGSKSKPKSASKKEDKKSAKVAKPADKKQPLKDKPEEEKKKVEKEK